MRLQSLEIVGFKSFADRTKLNFTGGITAVVGPNGSGKSNIADAVRWVLGEQSNRTLRSGRMEDVIFSGTQSRGAQGYAGVALTIDNRDRQLPVEHDEVTVSRRLYRSGESEYRINGALVRLRDIYELFLDTGLGRDGYSIIGQGRIAEIVSTKSEKRREIFEEAAGIAKYRYRKEQAQRQLDAAQENLTRLADIFGELEARVGPLRRQSETAKRYLALAEEKKRLEISLWMDTLEASGRLLQEQDDRLLLSRGHYDEVQGSIEQLTAQIEEQYSAMQQMLVQVEQARSRIRENEEEISQNRAALAVQQNDIDHQTRALESLGEELSQAALSRGEQEEAAARQQEQAEGLARQAADGEARLAALTEELAALERQRGEQQELSGAASQRRQALTQALEEAKVSDAASRTLLEETARRLEAAKAQNQGQSSAVEAARQELEQYQRLARENAETQASLQNSGEGYRLRCESRTQKAQESRAQLEKLQRARQDLATRIRLLQEMERSLEGYHGSVKFVMKAAQRGELGGVRGAVSQLISVDEAYALAVETALGGSMQHIVVEDETAAKRAIALLKNAKSGRATFLPMTAVKGRRLEERGLGDCAGFVGLACDLIRYEAPYDGVILSLLGRVAVAQTLDDAVAIAKRFGYRFRVVTLDGQLVNAGGSMTGGYLTKGGAMLGRAGEIARLQQEAQRLEESLEQARRQADQAEAQAGEAQAMLQGAEAELRTAKEEGIRLEGEMRRCRQAYEEAQARGRQLEEQFRQMDERIAQLEAEQLTSGQLAGKLAGELDQLEEQDSRCRQALEALAQQISDKSGEQTACQMELLTLHKDWEAAQLQLSSLRQTLEDADRQRQQAAQRQQQLQEQIEEHRRQMEHLSQRQQLLGEENAALSARVEQLLQARSGMEEAVTAQRRQEKELAGQREALSRDLARMEERKSTMQAEYDGIIARLWDEYELTRSEAAAIAQPLEDRSAAQKQLAQLKNSIKALGDVNVGAIEEYRQLSERYEFMKAQMEDAEHSRQKLTGLIGQLTGEMKTIFTEKFSRIAENFSEIFVELFGGGRAALSLSDPENVLESGIEIQVAPPGKIIKNLSLLSGGEQAFVAIAIYFAILKVNPAPFVLLDEIEAALDEVNVSRFAHYLRKLCGQTQFIAITHRRGTMEEADVLYGVTMQKEGVSKLLELDVAQVERQLGLQS